MNRLEVFAAFVVCLIIGTAVYVLAATNAPMTITVIANEPVAGINNHDTITVYWRTDSTKEYTPIVLSRTAQDAFSGTLPVEAISNTLEVILQPGAFADIAGNLLETGTSIQVDTQPPEATLVIGCTAKLEKE